MQANRAVSVRSKKEIKQDAHAINHPISSTGKPPMAFFQDGELTTKE